MNRRSFALAGGAAVATGLGTQWRAMGSPAGYDVRAADLRAPLSLRRPVEAMAGPAQ